MEAEAAVTHSPFLSWIDAPRADRGVRLASDTDDDFEFRSWENVAMAARRTAAAMIEAGVRPGDVVCVVLPTGFDCLSTIFGAWVAGATIAPLAPPSFEDDDEYVAHVSAILRQAGPTLVATNEWFEALIARAITDADLQGGPWIWHESNDAAELRESAPVALLQFTSGSTGVPLGVRVTWRNLEANFEVMKTFVDWQDGDGFASWLPLHHDMGLIGGLFFEACTQGNLWLMRPDQFVRDPLRWLRCFDAGKARLTASPSFSFGYLARKLKRGLTGEIDLSQWKAAIVGAEAVDAAALDAFARLAEPAGFSRRTYLPAYGLAENTLAVTATPPTEVPRISLPDWSELRFGEPVSVQATALLGDVEQRPGDGWIVGHGLPPEGVGVRIVDDEGQPLPAGHLGEVVVSGDSVADGYHQGRDGRSTRFLDGDLITGDAGFIIGDDLYLLGRMGDSLKLRGRTVYVEDIDAKLAAVTGLGRGHVAVVSMFGSGETGVALFAEGEPGEWVEPAVSALRRELGPEPKVTIVTGPRGLIQRTSSGKVRRRRMWQQLQQGELTDATVVA